MKAILAQAAAPTAAMITAMAAFAAPAAARPVSYPGGVTVIVENDDDMNSVLVHYTPRRDYAIGLRVEHIDALDAVLVGPQLNYLVKRWNGADSQANVYLFAAAGPVIGDVTKVGGFTEIATDWENRRLFASYLARVTLVDDAETQLRQSARIGVAPYVAEAGALHTWLMLQLDRFDGRGEEWRLTPLVRVFKGNFLGEAGVSLDGAPLVNVTYRF